MGWFKASVTADEAAISLCKGIRSYSVEWDNVNTVYAEKVDKVTYEEMFLIVEDDAGSAIEIGEFDHGFDEVQRSMLNNLRGFLVGWRATVESGEIGKRHLIWRRDQST